MGVGETWPRMVLLGQAFSDKLAYYTVFRLRYRVLLSSPRLLGLEAWTFFEADANLRPYGQGSAHALFSFCPIYSDNEVDNHNDIQ